MEAYQYMTAKMASKWVSKKARQRMRVSKMKKVHLARIMQVSPAYISKLLKGGENLTLKQLEQLANALGMNLTVNLS